MTTDNRKRGERLNNPLCIKRSRVPWRGKVTPSSDPVFEEFDTAHNGIRAGTKNLLTYKRKYGRETVEDIVSAWSPEVENDTDSYIRRVCIEMGVAADTRLSLDENTLVDLVTAMIRVEQGRVIYTETEIRAAVRDALEVDVPLVTQPTSKPARKVQMGMYGGGAAGAVAFILAYFWQMFMPDKPLDTEVAIILGGAFVWLGQTLSAYMARERAEPSEV